MSLHMFYFSTVSWPRAINRRLDIKVSASSGVAMKLDNDVIRGPVIMVDVHFFLIAYPFCINCRKGKKNPSLL